MPEAAVRKGTEVLTLRRGEEGTLRIFIDTTNVVHGGWRPPLVHEDWHAICQAVYRGTEGDEWVKPYSKNVEKGKAVNPFQPSTSRKAKTLWKGREAKANGGNTTIRVVGDKFKVEPSVSTRRRPDEDSCRRRTAESSTAGGSIEAQLERPLRVI